MKVNFNLATLILISSISCSSPAKKDNSKKNNPVISYTLYEDIDPYTLNGINQIKDASAYPYIKVEDKNGNKKRIVYMITPIDSVVRIYEEHKFAGMSNGKSFSSWYTAYSNKIEGDSLKTIELLYPDFIAEFTYLRPEKKDAYLLKGSIIEQDTVTAYFTDKDPRFCPEANIAFIDNVKHKAEVIVTKKMAVKENKLRITTSSFNTKTNKITNSAISCFQGGKRSWFWLQHFVPQSKPCK